MLFDGCHQFVIGLIGWKLRMIFLICSVLLNRKPALLAWIMPRSLWLSPLAMVWKPMDCSAFTVVYLEFSTRILNPVISPLSATSRELQKIVGYPSFSSEGPQTVKRCH